MEAGYIEHAHAIALLRANALGDFVFLLPALDALRQAYPAAHISLLAKPWHARFLHDRACGIDEVVEIPAMAGFGGDRDRTSPAEVRDFFAAMRERRFDIAFQLHGGGAHSNPFVKRLGARLTIGARAAHAPALDRWLPYTDLQNERLRLLELVGLAGAPPASLDPRLPLIPRDAEELALKWRGDGRPLAVLQPGANDPRRRWPAQRFAKVGDALAAKGAQIAINGTLAERETTAAVAASMRAPVTDLTGALSISGLAALLARASLVVSNDTGPLHLAQALGTPTVGIYWLANLVTSTPLSWAGRRVAVSLSQRCPVCGAPNLHERCPHDVSFVEDVALDEVLGLALELFRPRARRTSARGRAPAPAPGTPAFRADPRPPDEALH